MHQIWEKYKINIQIRFAYGYVMCFFLGEKFKILLSEISIKENFKWIKVRCRLKKLVFLVFNVFLQNNF